MSVPENLDLVARQQKLDQYLLAHPRLRFDRLIGMVAQVVNDSGYEKELWKKYIGGNPLKMQNATYTELFDALSDMLDDIKDENGKGTLPEGIRKPRINLWISELAIQLGRDAYTDASAKHEGARLLARGYKKCRPFVTEQTQAEITKLLSSDRISEEDKHLFQ